MDKRNPPINPLIKVDVSYEALMHHLSMLTPEEQHEFYCTLQSNRSLAQLGKPSDKETQHG